MILQSEDVVRLASEHVDLMLQDLLDGPSRAVDRALARVEEALRSIVSAKAGVSALRFEYEPRDGGRPAVRRNGAWVPLPISAVMETALLRTATAAATYDRSTAMGH